MSEKFETKKCKNCKQEFIIESEDFAFYERMEVPAPTHCPQCRVERRMQFYNARSLYKRKCDLCQQDTFAIYPEGTDFPVYCPPCWWSDKWDITQYSLDYDPSQAFFPQFKKLYDLVPRVALEVDYQRSINSQYSNACGPVKNCYLVFLAEDCEDTMYSFLINHLTNCLDCVSVDRVENGYELFNCLDSYNLSFSSHCRDCLDIKFCHHCQGCSNCFGCVNLKKKSYCIFNKQYSKEEYQSKMAEFNTGSYQQVLAIIDKVSKLSLEYPKRFMEGVRNENVSGDFIDNSKNIRQSFQIKEGENLKYCQILELGPTKDCYDYTSWGQNATNIYETVHAGTDVNNVKFNHGTWGSYNTEYCDNPIFANNLFGCVFLRKKSYCILNKQYSKEEYLKLREKMIEKMKEDGEYGEFFPVELSPFAYNETIAQDYFPLTKEEALKKGYRWKEREARNYEITLETKDLPDDIKDAKDNITKEVIQCSTPDKDKEKQNCTEAFKIIKSELDFYKQHNLPLPRYCPNCRHYQRLQQRNPLKLYTRTCMHKDCTNEFETTYSPDRPEVIYCERCYQNEVA